MDQGALLVVDDESRAQFGESDLLKNTWKEGRYITLLGNLIALQEHWHLRVILLMDSSAQHIQPGGDKVNLIIGQFGIQGPTMIFNGHPIACTSFSCSKAHDEP